MRGRDDATVSATDRKRFGSKVQWREAALSMYRRSLESDVGAESVERVLALRRWRPS